MIERTSMKKQWEYYKIKTVMSSLYNNEKNYQRKEEKRT